jgi:conserved oligomeric Golgi complex subunit 3
VTDHLETCDGLMNKVDGIEREVEDMLDGWKGVEDSGKSLKDACEKLLEERVCFFYHLSSSLLMLT